MITHAKPSRLKTRKDLRGVLVGALVLGLVFLIPIALGYVDLGFRIQWQTPMHVAIYAGVPVIELGVVALLAVASQHRLRNAVIATWICNFTNFLAVVFFGVFGSY